MTYAMLWGFMICDRCHKEIIASSTHSPAFDDDMHHIVKPRRRVPLPPIQWQLLTLLRRTHPRVATKGYLETVWDEYDRERGKYLLNVYICHLRAGLKGSGWVILTVRGVGFQLKRG